LHLNHLDDFFENSSVGRLAGQDDLFGVLDRADGAIEQPPFLFQDGALHVQGVGQLEGILIQKELDLLQREPEEFERNNLLQALEIAQSVNPIAGCSAPGFEQSQTIVVMQGPNRDPGQLCELVYPVQLAHSVPLSQPCSGLTQRQSQAQSYSGLCWDS
jgi:hypothetical protein